jgi:hypothetical protein
MDSKENRDFLTSDESAAFRAFEEAKKLREAVSANNQSLVKVSLERLRSDNRVTYDGHLFTAMLASLNGADIGKLFSFEEYVSSVVSAWRHLGRIEAALDSAPDGLVDSSNAVQSLNRHAGLAIDVAKQYLDGGASWMQIPWLTDFLLLLIFDGLLLTAKISVNRPDLFSRFRENSDVGLWLTNLARLRSEIDSRSYDPEELIRRLRHLEDSKAEYVMPSLVYRLLESQT